jgi:hypothetical protein
VVAKRPALMRSPKFLCKESIAFENLSFDLIDFLRNKFFSSKEHIKFTCLVLIAISVIICYWNSVCSGCFMCVALLASILLGRDLVTH